MASFYGGKGNNWMVGTGDADTFTGRDGNDLIRGRAGDDQILGGGGNDIIRGGRGDDTIYLKIFGGNDIVTGGQGADTFYIGTKWAHSSGDVVTITDFDHSEDELVIGHVGDLWDLAQAGGVLAFESGDDVVFHVQGPVPADLNGPDETDYTLVFEDTSLNDWSVDDFIYM